MELCSDTGVDVQKNETKRPLLIFLIVVTALMMSSLDQTIVATALHALQQDLKTSIAWSGWTITAYALGLMISVPLAGKFSERYGRRRIFLISVGVFTLASFLCGLANNIHVLVALRFLQALGGAGFTPSATGIIVDHLGPARDRAVGLFGSVFPIGGMIGPIFGGFFVNYASWRWIFFVNVPIGVVLLLLALKFIPADVQAADKRSEPFDFAGMLLLASSVLSMMLAMNALAEGSSIQTSVLAAFLLLLSFVLLVFFLRSSKKKEKPFIPIRLMTGEGFFQVNLINVAGGMTQGIIVLIPLYATVRYGIGALGSGTLLTAEGLIAVLVSIFAVWVLRRTGYRKPIVVGLACNALGAILLSVPYFGPSPYAWLAFAAGIIGLGMGWLSPASRNAGLQLLPRQAPTLAALRTMCMQFGAIATVSITTAVLAHAADPVAWHTWMNVFWALLLLLLIFVARRVPEHHGAW